MQLYLPIISAKNACLDERVPTMCDGVVNLKFGMIECPENAHHSLFKRTENCFFGMVVWGRGTTFFNFNFCGTRILNTCCCFITPLYNKKILEMALGPRR